jgi:hypothetical protein
MRRILTYSAIILGTIVVDCSAFVFYAALTNPPRNNVNAESMTDDKYTGMADPQAGFAIRPNLILDSQRINDNESSIYTDNRGARRDRPGELAPSAVDLLTIGCSQAFGAGVQNEQTFTSVLARKLGLRAANYSVSGYGGVGSLFRLRERLDQQPKLVIYGFWEDHLNRNVRRCALIDAPVCLEMGRVAIDSNGNPYYARPAHAERSFALSRRFYRETTSDSNRWRSFGTDVFWSAMRLWQETERNLGLRDSADVMSASDKLRAAKFVLSEMKKAAEGSNAQLVVVYIPIYFDSVVKDAPAELASSARELGITWISMTERFNEFKRDGRQFTIPNDGHLNELGHSAVADEIERKLSH